jgi:superfamily II DNA or RNA helicase
VAVMNRHVADGATVVGLTATPVDLGHCYDTLVVGGNNSDGRACGALVPVKRHFSPTEPDMRAFKGIPEGEDVSEKKAIKAVMSVGIFGNVFKNWKEGNPDARPAIGFGPGVKESQGFAEDFFKRGVRCAHIDGDNIWVNGEMYASDAAAREQIIHDHKTGRIPALWNRFILREGLDLKWAEYGILATIFGSIQTYLQVGGRFLRACPESGKTSTTIQDHGGHWHRLGSLNADQEWKLEYTGKMVAGMRLERIRAGKEKEPYRCPKCTSVMRGQACLVCGNQITRRSRTVMQSDGKLFNMEGQIYTPRPVDTRTDAARDWEKVFWRARKSKKGLTYRQAFGLYAYEHAGLYPPAGLPFMPTNEADFYRLVRDVDFKNLTSKPKE